MAASCCSSIPLSPSNNDHESMHSHSDCNKLQLIIGRGTHTTDISRPTFNGYQDGGYAKHEVQLKSTMGSLAHDA